MNAHNGSDHKPGDAWVAGIPRSRLLSVPIRIDFLSQRKKLGASAAFAADRAWVWRKPKDQTRRHLTKNLSQGSINQQIFPLIPERFLSELPEPPLRLCAPQAASQHFGELLLHLSNAFSDTATVAGDVSDLWYGAGAGRSSSSRRQFRT